MEKRIINCNICGNPMDAPQSAQEEYKNPNFHLHEYDLLCKDCGSPNLQSQGRCLVCLDCGYETCNG